MCQTTTNQTKSNQTHESSVAEYLLKNTWIVDYTDDGWVLQANTNEWLPLTVFIERYNINVNL